MVKFLCKINPFFIGIRILDGPVVDKLEAKALEYENDYIDIYSASWGPRDNGQVMDGPNPLTEKALQNGAEKVNKETSFILFF